MADGVSKVERILNVLAILLDTNRLLSRAEITQSVAGYPESDVACRRTFERDKETLRAMGVPIITEALADGVETGYRVRPSDYFLADLQLRDDEAAALQLAVSAVALDTHAGVGALLKLSGNQATETPLIAALPTVPALAAVFDGIRHRAELHFVYRGKARRVQPWALRSARGRWYLIAHDTGVEQRRTFRADRIEGLPTLHNPGSFDIPPEGSYDSSIGESPWDLGDGEAVEVCVAFDAPHHVGALDRLGPEATASNLDDGRVAVRFSATSLSAVRNFVIGFLEHAEVLEPPELRTSTIEWLQAIASTHA
jgi:proteasome accessory factor B